MKGMRGISLNSQLSDLRLDIFLKEKICERMPILSKNR